MPRPDNPSPWLLVSRSLTEEEWEIVFQAMTWAAIQGFEEGEKLWEILTKMTE